MKNSDFKVINLNLNKGNESSIIKFNEYKFLLKTIGIGAYGTDRVANLFVILPNGEKAFVQTICFVRFATSEDFNNLCVEKDCYIREVATWEETIEHSKQFINILYGN